MEEWFEIVVEILQNHKQGNYSILQEAQTLPDNAPLEIKALLCMSLCQVAMDANEAELAKQYLKMAIECADNDATNMVQHQQLFYLECLLYSKFFHFFDKTIAKARGSRYKNHYLMQSIVGDCLYWCGYFSEAKEIYAKILANNTAEDFNSEEYEYKLASACIQLGEHEESRQVLEQIIANHPNIGGDTPEYVFHALGELVTLDPNSAQLYTKKLQDLDVQHPYKNAYIHYILGLELYLLHALGLQEQDNLDKAVHLFHSVLQSPIRSFEKLPSVRYLIHIHHTNQQQDVIKKLQSNYSFANMFWEEEIQNLLSPEKLASPIETQEPPYEEDCVDTAAQSLNKIPQVADTAAKNKDTTQQTIPSVKRVHRSILPNVPSTTKTFADNVSPTTNASEDNVSPATNASEDNVSPATNASEDNVSPATNASEDNVSPATNASENNVGSTTDASENNVGATTDASENNVGSTTDASENAENTDNKETSIPLTALLLGLESFHKQN